MIHCKSESANADLFHVVARLDDEGVSRAQSGARSSIEDPAPPGNHPERQFRSRQSSPPGEELIRTAPRS